MNFNSEKLLERAEFLEDMIADSYDATTIPRRINTSEMRRDLVKLHPIFGVYMDFGFRPRLGFDGTVMLPDGTILFSDSLYSPRDNENPKVIWTP